MSAQTDELGNIIVSLQNIKAALESQEPEAGEPAVVPSPDSPAPEAPATPVVPVAPVEQVAPNTPSATLTVE